MAFKLNSAFITSALALATPLITPLLTGRGARYQTIASQAVRAAVTASDDGLDHLLTVFRNFEAKNPLVQTAVSEFSTLAQAAGVSLPTLDAVESHLKSAIYDLATALVPADQLTASTPGTPVTAG